MLTITLSLQRNAQRGSLGEGGSCVGPRVDLPVHCYLLLRHKGAPWRGASGRKARRRMSQLKLNREEDPRLFPMTTLSSMNTIYATGSLFSNRTPSPWSLFFTSHTCHIHRDPPCLLWSASSFYSPPPPFSLYLRAKSREMLPKHCKLIAALNIYYMMAGGLHGRDVRVRERAGEQRWLLLRLIIMITHFVSDTGDNFSARFTEDMIIRTKRTNLCLIQCTNWILIAFRGNLPFLLFLHSNSILQSSQPNMQGLMTDQIKCQWIIP